MPSAGCYYNVTIAYQALLSATSSSRTFSFSTEHRYRVNAWLVYSEQLVIRQVNTRAMVALKKGILTAVSPISKSVWRWDDGNCSRRLWCGGTWWNRIYRPGIITPKLSSFRINWPCCTNKFYYTLLNYLPVQSIHLVKKLLVWRIW